MRNYSVRLKIENKKHNIVGVNGKATSWHPSTEVIISTWLDYEGFYNRMQVTREAFMYNKH